MLEEFLGADTVVIGAPMYNFTIPSQLKAWIDRIAVAGKTFRYTENGPEGLVGDKRVIIALARGGIYSEGSPARALEHLESYLRGLFNFVGIEPEFVVADGLGIEPRAARDRDRPGHWRNRPPRRLIRLAAGEIESSRLLIGRQEPRGRDFPLVARPGVLTFYA